MKYDITFSCGHTHTVDIYGSAAERERKIKWYEAEAVCPDCYKAQKDAEAAEGCSEVEMSYSEYKTNYASCKTKLNSYNKETKPSWYMYRRPKMRLLRPLKGICHLGEYSGRHDPCEPGRVYSHTSQICGRVESRNTGFQPRGVGQTGELGNRV